MEFALQGVDIVNVYAVVLTRSLRVKRGEFGDEYAEVSLQVGVRNADSQGGLIEGHAAFRIVPLMDWQVIHGVDAIQAVQLAIQTGEMVAESLGATWSDETPSV